ncbi:MAG TPA: copper chaperone PCu(A)C [Rubrivivax sp.]|nr:copper chaperone PCu(A)C [Rubrivivax sp.]
MNVLRLPLLLLSTWMWCNGALAQVAKVESAWARPTVAGQSAGGAYLKITGGALADRLLSASSPVAQHAELHTMTMEGDIMRMRSIDAVAVPPGQTVELKPGGMHLMFVGLAQPLKSGSRFPLTLRFEKAGAITVQVKVAAQAP